MHVSSGKHIFLRRGSPGGMVFNWLLQSPPRLLLLSFAFVICSGAFLLMLPRASVSGTSLSFIDAFFTSASATCVTGLTVLDTGSAFTAFGQIVILTLIQLGGLGIMTFSTFFMYLFAGKISFAEREILIDTFNQNPIGDLIRLLRIIFIYTAAVETAGWILLSLKFMQVYPPEEAIYRGLFHAVSAFCNAGFALFPDSFTGFRGDLFVNTVIGFLIVLGGLGFIVILDIFRNRNSIISGQFRKLSFHSRVVLLSTGALILTGTLFFLVLEYTNILKGLPLSQKLIVSFFQSVTTRTAGFNTVDMGMLSGSSLLFIMLLMFIGASPGSCGGGIKTTTFVVLMASMRSKFRMKEEVNVLYRRIPDSTVSRVVSIMFFSIFIISLFIMLLLVSEMYGASHSATKGFFFEYVFEVVSAFGTVGLSMGVTPHLSGAGKILITLLMFIGRLGPLTVVLAMQRREKGVKFKYVQEDVLVG